MSALKPQIEALLAVDETYTAQLKDACREIAKLVEQKLSKIEAFDDEQIIGLADSTMPPRDKLWRVLSPAMNDLSRRAIDSIRTTNVLNVQLTAFLNNDSIFRRLGSPLPNVAASVEVAAYGLMKLLAPTTPTSIDAERIRGLGVCKLAPEFPKVLGVDFFTGQFSKCLPIVFAAVPAIDVDPTHVVALKRTSSTNVSDTLVVNDETDDLYFRLPGELRQVYFLTSADADLNDYVMLLENGQNWQFAPANALCRITEGYHRMVEEHNRLWTDFRKSEALWAAAESEFTVEELVCLELLLLDASRYGCAPTSSTPENKEYEPLYVQKFGRFVENDFFNDLHAFTPLRLDGFNEDDERTIRAMERQSAMQWQCTKHMHSNIFKRIRDARLVGRMIGEAQAGDTPHYPGDTVEHDEFVRTVDEITNEPDNLMASFGLELLCAFLIVRGAVLKSPVYGSSDGFVANHALHGQRLQVGFAFRRLRVLIFKAVSVMAHEALKAPSIAWVRAVRHACTRTSATIASFASTIYAAGSMQNEFAMAIKAHVANVRKSDVVVAAAPAGVSAYAFDSPRLCARIVLKFDTTGRRREFKLDDNKIKGDFIGVAQGFGLGKLQFVYKYVPSAEAEGTDALILLEFNLDTVATDDFQMLEVDLKTLYTNKVFFGATSRVKTWIAPRSVLETADDEQAVLLFAPLVPNKLFTKQTQLFTMPFQNALTTATNTVEGPIAERVHSIRNEFDFDDKENFHWETSYPRNLFTRESVYFPDALASISRVPIFAALYLAHRDQDVNESERVANPHLYAFNPLYGDPTDLSDQEFERALLPPFYHEHPKIGETTRFFPQLDNNTYSTFDRNTVVRLARFLHLRVSQASYMLRVVRMTAQPVEMLKNQASQLKIVEQSVHPLLFQAPNVHTSEKLQGFSTDVQKLVPFLLPTLFAADEIEEFADETAVEEAPTYQKIANLFYTYAVSSVKEVDRLNRPQPTELATSELSKILKEMASVASRLGYIKDFGLMVSKASERKMERRYDKLKDVSQLVLQKASAIADDFISNHAEFEDAVRSYAELAAFKTTTVDEPKRRFMAAYESIQAFRSNYNKGILGVVVYLVEAMNNAVNQAYGPPKLVAEVVSNVQFGIKSVLTSELFSISSKEIEKIWTDSGIDGWLEGFEEYLRLCKESLVSAGIGATIASAPFRDLAEASKSAKYADQIRCARMFDSFEGMAGGNRNLFLDKLLT